MATQRQSYTLEFKFKAIGEVKNRQNKKDACSKYKIAPSTLATLLKNEKQLVSAKKSQKFHAKVKKMRRANHDSLDTAVFLWIKQARAMGIPISGAFIMAKADRLAVKLNICDFKANHGWLYRFKIR